VLLRCMGRSAVTRGNPRAHAAATRLYYHAYIVAHRSAWLHSLHYRDMCFTVPFESASTTTFVTGVSV